MQRIFLFIKTSATIFLICFCANNIFAQAIPDSLVRQNITIIKNPLQRLTSLEPATFEYNNDKFRDLQLPAGKQYGFLSENVQQVFPDLVSYRQYSYRAGKNMLRTAKIKSVDTESLIPVLVASVKEQQAEIEKLKTEIESLKKQFNAMK
jgi:hypothetical protein